MQKRHKKKQVLDSLYLTDDGVHFDDSQLWLDSKKNGELSFLSSASFVRERYKNQIIVSEESYKLLKLYNPQLKALTCQYNRPFSIGRYNLELFPSGNILGGASLSIEAEKEKILYAPLYSDAKPFLTRASQAPQADYLVIKANYYETNRPTVNRKKELERLISQVRTCLIENKIPIIFSPLLHSSNELCKAFSKEEINTTVHKHIYDINKIYESFGYDVGQYNLWNTEKLPSNTVLILPKSCRSQKILQFSKNREFFFVNNGIDLSHNHKTEQIFNLPLADMGTNISALIKKVQPKKTFIFGPYANKVIQAQKLTKESIEVLYPFNQKSLL